MRSFFNQTHRRYSAALVILLVTGCTALPAPEQEEAAPPPAIVETPVPPINCPVCEAPAMQEDPLSQRQLKEYAGFRKLLEDLARYSNLNAEETQRAQTELSNRVSAAAQRGENENRIRLAYLLSLHPSGLNDQQAISMLETVAKNENALTPLQHLAGALRTQIQEKQRALQKLDALRKIDRQLLEERMTGSKTTPPRPLLKALPKQP